MYFSEHMENRDVLNNDIHNICSTTEVSSLIGVLGHVDFDAMRDSFRPSLGICNGISDRRVVASVAMQASLIRYNISQNKMLKTGKAACLRGEGTTCDHPKDCFHPNRENTTSDKDFCE
jgi:hypothetical protein